MRPDLVGKLSEFFLTKMKRKERTRKEGEE
jgi:hypothetical protein